MRNEPSENFEQHAHLKVVGLSIEDPVLHGDHFLPLAVSRSTVDSPRPR
jgi:hypothetical protein